MHHRHTITRNKFFFFCPSVCLLLRIAMKDEDFILISTHTHTHTEKKKLKFLMTAEDV